MKTVMAKFTKFRKDMDIEKDRNCIPFPIYVWNLSIYSCDRKVERMKLAG